MKILDTHHHLWDLSLRSYDWIKELPSNESKIIDKNFIYQDLVNEIEKNDVYSTICVQAHQSEGEAKWLLNIANDSQIIKGVVGWIDLKSPKIEYKLDKFQKNEKFVGVRHVWHDEKDESWIINPEVIRGLKALSIRNINFDFLVRPNHLKYIHHIFDEIPDLNGVIDHIAKPEIKEGNYEPWATEIYELSKINNLSCKISGIIEEMNDGQPLDEVEKYSSHIINSFGKKRIMYGSNWPVCLTKNSYEFVLNLAKNISSKFSDLEKEDFFFNNGSRFYKV